MKLPSLLLVLLLLLAAACGPQAPALSEPDPTVPTRAAESPAPSRAPDFVGVVTSRVSKVITADFEGRVLHLDLRDGQYVHAGDVVAKLDDTELRSQLAELEGKKKAAQAQEARAYALANNAARKALVEKRLMRLGASSPDAYRTAASEASADGADGGVAAGQIAEATAQIDQLHKLIASADVQAPIDGVVSVVKVKEGEVAHKGTAIARVFDPGALVIRFAVPPTERAAVAPGTAVELVTDDHRVVPATVQRAEEAHDPAIEFVVVEASLDPGTHPDAIRVGDHGHVRVASPARELPR